MYYHSGLGQGPLEKWTKHWIACCSISIRAPINFLKNIDWIWVEFQGFYVIVPKWKLPIRRGPSIRLEVLGKGLRYVHIGMQYAACYPNQIRWAGYKRARTIHFNCDNQWFFPTREVNQIQKSFDTIHFYDIKKYITLHPLFQKI